MKGLVNTFERSFVKIKIGSAKIFLVSFGDIICFIILLKGIL